MDNQKIVIKSLSEIKRITTILDFTEEEQEAAKKIIRNNIGSERNITLEDIYEQLRLERRIKE